MLGDQLEVGGSVYIKRAASRHLPQFALITNSVLKVIFVHTEWKMRQP